MLPVYYLLFSQEAHAFPKSNLYWTQNLLFFFKYFSLIVARPLDKDDYFPSIPWLKEPWFEHQFSWESNIHIFYDYSIIVVS